MTIYTSICILTYNRCSSVMALLGSIQHLADAVTEIIVVDNHSSDDTCECVTETFKNVRYFRTEKNIGAAGRNVAFRQARGSMVLCLDDDVFGLTGEMLAALREKFLLQPKIGAINFRVVDATTGLLCNWVHHCKPEEFCDGEFFTYEITEGAVAFRKEALDRAGHYDDIYFISHEGPDLAFRIMREGYDCIYWGGVVVRHRHENSGRVSWLNYYYDTRNHIYLATKNFPILYALRYLTVGLGSMLVYSLRDGFFSYWVKAVRDGVGDLPLVRRKRERLPEGVMQRIAAIDRFRAPLLYKVRTRLFKRSARL